jgi:TatD DNase family protein
VSWWRTSSQIPILKLDSKIYNMIDTHAHLDEIKEIDRAIQRAKDAGIRAIVAVGMDLASNVTTLNLAEQFPDVVHPAIGYHPWSISTDTIEENLKFIEENLPSCIALGEVGIDYKTKVKKPVQWEVFSRVLSLAIQHNRPIIVHSRFSHQRSHQMVRDSRIEKAIFHWYTGSLEILEKIIDDGYYISATPALAYSPPHQAAMKAAPIERILVETDSPVEYQEKVSEPADLIMTLRELSNLKGMEIKEVQRITTNNAKRFFGI